MCRCVASGDEASAAPITSRKRLICFHLRAIAGTSHSQPSRSAARTADYAQYYLDKEWIALDPASGRVYLTYTNFTAGLDRIANLLDPLPERGSPRLAAARSELNALRYLDRALREIESLRLARAERR